MGRRSSRPSPPRRRAPPPAPRRSSSSTASRAPAKAAPPAKTQQQAASPPAAAAPAAGGGFMANIASTAAGVAIGRGLDRAFFGGGGSATAPEEYPEEAPAATSNFGAESPVPESVCTRFVDEFKACLERSNHSIQACEWNLQLLQQCQQQNTGFAEAPQLSN